MMELDFNEGRNFPLRRFEAMLKTNDVLFFDADDFELIICHYLGAGNMALAGKAVKMGLSQHPQSSVLKLLKVEILLFKNKVEEAEEILNTLFELEPYNPDVYIHRANVYSKKDLHEEAIDLLLTAADILDDEEEICSPIAMEYMFMEDYQKAKYYFIKCLEYDENDSAALYNVMYCFDFLGQPQEAVDFLNIYLDKHPYSEVGWHQIGLQFITLGQHEKALTSFDFAIICDDLFVGAYMEKAKVLERLNRFAEAIECYQITLEIEDPTAFAFLRIGRCFEKLNRPKPAIEFYEKALDEDPLMDKIWITITDFYQRQKNYKKALYYIERALAIDEKNAAYWTRYAKINKHLKRYDQAEKGVQRSIVLEGETALETWVEQADFFIEIDDYNQALELVEKAEQYEPFSAEIEFRLAALFLVTDRWDDGLDHLKKALQIDAEYISVVKELFPELFTKKHLQKFIDQYS